MQEAGNKTNIGILLCRFDGYKFYTDIGSGCRKCSFPERFNTRAGLLNTRQTGDNPLKCVLIAPCESQRKGHRINIPDEHRISCQRKVKRVSAESLSSAGAALPCH